MKQTSFWEQKTFHQPYDLIIIGAGIVGLSSALFYRRQHPDARILVLDKGPIPEGASTRNAGFACTGSITEHVADIEKEAKKNIKKRLKMRYEGLHLLRKTLGDKAIGYDNCGGFEIFTEDAKYEEACSYIGSFNRWMSNLAGEKMVYKPDTLNGYPAIYNRLEGAIHPGRMMQALIANVSQHGITIRWNTEVQKIDGNGSVNLDGGTAIEGDQILVACNGFTRRLMPEILVRPARGYIMVSEEWPDIPWKGTFNFDRGYIYFRNIGNRLLIGGGRNRAIEDEEQDEFGTNETVKTYLQDFAREVLHLPQNLSFEYEWSGIMGFTSTKTPVVKRLDDDRVVAAGLSGMGIAIGMKVGKEAARILIQK
jgi:glycine/D-amino acid oxidase-like deaminating enzyme